MIHAKVALHSGFCPGVRATIKKIEETLKIATSPVYSVGLPVHNPQLTERLVSDGLCVVQSLDEIPKGTLIVRAHGFMPSALAKAREKGLCIVDTTCVFVRKAQEIAQKLYKEGCTVVITGERDHPEMLSLVGFAGGDAIVVSSIEEAKKLVLDGKRVGLLSQTTQPSVFFDSVAEIFKAKPLAQLQVMDTICAGLQKTQDAAKQLARKVDVMLVVGGKMSSNTKRLFEACAKENPRCYHIETARELSPSLLKGAKAVGITAGASTPDWIVDSIRQALEVM